MESEGGRFAVPTLYDISGSAQFYNKCDYGFTVYREKDFEEKKLSNNIEIHWQKIKYKNLGQTGKSELVYNYDNGRFEKRGTQNFDNSNWLQKEKQPEIDFAETKEIPF
jgi:twinkle protein